MQTPKEKICEKVFARAAILILAVLIGCQPGAKQAEGPQTTGLPIKVGSDYWPGAFWLDIADKKGWFKEAGLNIEIINTHSDYVGSLTDMVAGKMDTNTFSLFDLMKFNIGGADLVMVVNSDTSLGAEAILAKPGIESLIDLKGKSIGVNRNSYLEYILSVALARKNILLGDVTLKNVPGEKSVEALSKGTVDAVVTWGSSVDELIKNGAGRKLFDTSEVPGISPNGQVFHRSFIEKRPGDLQAYVNVWHKTTEFIKENPGEAFGIIASIYDKTPGEAQAFAHIDKILDLRDNIIGFSYGAGFESLHGASHRISEFLIETGVTEKRLDSAEFLDARFIRALKRNSK
ncbi:MAG: ABC transporter substrate-binding protein [Nitrospinae bacterium]|nr:ABC transporter substrate-binding protein [Nitrospinota bacterium]